MSSYPALKYVDHTYRDFSRYLEEGGELIRHKKCEANFPAKLHRMVSEPRNSQAITWMPHGRSFKVLNKELLSSSVLPEYFKFNKYDSFTRQLNGWGFIRLHRKGTDFGCYYHEAFLRGLPVLTTMVRRLSPNQGKSIPFPEGEPNFYRISETYPVPPLSHPNASAESQATEVVTATLAAPTHDSSQHEMKPSPSSSMKPSIQKPSADLATASVSTSAPSHDLSHGPPDRVSTADSSAAATSAAASSAASNHDNSYDFEHPSSSATTSTRPPTQGFAAGLAYHSSPSHQMPQYHHQLQGHRSYSHTPYQTNHSPSNYDHHVHYDRYPAHEHYANSYHWGREPPEYPRYSAPGIFPEFQYSPQRSPPQYQYPPFPSEQYYNHPPANVAPTTERYLSHFTSSREHYDLSQRESNTEDQSSHINRNNREDHQSMLPPSDDSHISHDENDRRRNRSPREGDVSPMIEPIPYTARRDNEEGKTDYGPASPVHKTE